MSVPVALPRPHAAARTRVAVVVALLSAISIILPLAPAAVATTAEAGSVGSVTVEPATGLPLEGAEVVVRGTGFDPAAGVYVAVCVDNGPGEKPTPCIGGADTAGVGGAVWVSDTPPSYAEGLTQPYGPDGSFEVTLPVPVADDVTGVDCRVVTCAVTVRFDHLRADDRRADHVVPVSFADGAADEAAGPGAEPTAPTDEPADGAADEPADGPTAATDEPTAGAAPVDGSDAVEASGGSPVSTGTGLAVAVGALAVAAAAIGGWLVRRRRADGAAPTDPTA